MSGSSFFDDESMPSRPLLILGSPSNWVDSNPIVSGNVMVKGGSFGASSIVRAKLFYGVLILQEIASQDVPPQTLGHIELELIRTKYSISDTSNYKYCLSFHRLGYSFDLYFKDFSAMQVWHNNLAKYCILGEFEHRYEVIEIIGKGSMGEVEPHNSRSTRSNDKAMESCLQQNPSRSRAFLRPSRRCW